MGKKYEQFKKEMQRIKKESDKKSVTVYFILRSLVILCLVLEVLRGDMNNAFLCLLSLILFTMPFFIERKFKVELPTTLEIIIMLFIFAAEILGEINNFYGIIPYWDTILHTLNGFLCAAVGFALFDLINKNVKNINLSPVFLSIVAFCFSMTIGVLWEFFEYNMDNYLGTDMQKDRIVRNIKSVKLNETGENVPVVIDDIENIVIYSKNKEGETIITEVDGYLDIGLIDTMKDLIVNFIGAVVFSLFGYLYILNRDKYRFVNHFIPTKKI